MGLLQTGTGKISHGISCICVTWWSKHTWNCQLTLRKLIKQNFTQAAPKPAFCADEVMLFDRHDYSSAHYTLSYPQSSTSCHDIRLLRGWGGGWRCHDTLSTLVITPSPCEERQRGLRVGVIEEVALTYVRWTRSCPYRSRYPRGSDWFGNSSLCWCLQRNRKRSLLLMAVTTCSGICWQQFKWPLSWSWNWELKGILHPKLQFVHLLLTPISKDSLINIS